MRKVKRGKGGKNTFGANAHGRGEGFLRKVYNIEDCMAKCRENKWEKGRAGEGRREAGKGERRKGRTKTKAEVSKQSISGTSPESE